MTLFRRRVTLFRPRVTVHVTLRDYAELYRRRAGAADADEGSTDTCRK
jgi:hypothetical protein